jgi:hypothetical protein
VNNTKLSDCTKEKLLKEAQYYFENWNEYEIYAKRPSLSIKEKLKCEQYREMYKFKFNGISKAIEIIGLDWDFEFDSAGKPTNIILSSMANSIKQSN